jgi:hypothetical protein
MTDHQNEWSGVFRVHDSTETRGAERLYVGWDRGLRKRLEGDGSPRGKEVGSPEAKIQRSNTYKIVCVKKCAGASQCSIGV